MSKPEDGLAKIFSLLRVDRQLDPAVLRAGVHAAHPRERTYARLDFLAITLDLRNHPTLRTQLVAQLLRGTDRHDLAPGDDNRPRTGLLYFMQNVRTEQNGVSLAQFLYQVAGFTNLVGIQPDRRLVQDEHLGIVHDRVRQPHPLPHALGELTDRPVHEFREPAPLRHAFDRRHTLRITHTTQFAAEIQKLAHPLLGVERCVLRQVADTPTNLERVLKNVKPADRGRPARGRVIAGENSNGRRFTGPVGPQDADHLALLHTERDAVHRENRSVSLT